MTGRCCFAHGPSSVVASKAGTGEEAHGNRDESVHADPSYILESISYRISFSSPSLRTMTWPQAQTSVRRMARGVFADHTAWASPATRLTPALVQMRVKVALHSPAPRSA